MSVRLLTLTMCAGLIVFAAGSQAQTAPQTNPASAIKLAQAVPPPAVVPAKTKKNKIKKPAAAKSNTGSASHPPQPEPPDRSKYY